MRIFLDECVDWRLARDLTGHEVASARQMGWTAIANGELLALAAQRFEVFVTVDRNRTACQIQRRKHDLHPNPKLDICLS
jgi:hypothetical protein